MRAGRRSPASPLIATSCRPERRDVEPRPTTRRRARTPAAAGATATAGRARVVGQRDRRRRPVGRRRAVLPRRAGVGLQSVQPAWSGSGPEDSGPPALAAELPGPGTATWSSHSTTPVVARTASKPSPAAPRPRSALPGRPSLGVETRQVSRSGSGPAARTPSGAG